METLGKWLKIMRVKEELNLKTFAEQMGFNSSAYASGIESGRIKPSKEFVNKLLTIFPQYEDERALLEKLVKESIELVNERQEVSSEGLKLARNVSELSKPQQTAFFQRANELLNDMKKKGDSSD